MSTNHDVARAGLQQLAAEWHLRPLSDATLATYTTALAAHNADDVRCALQRVREAGRNKPHSMIPLLYVLITHVRAAYLERVSTRLRSAQRSEAA